MEPFHNGSNLYTLFLEFITEIENFICGGVVVDERQILSLIKHYSLFGVSILLGLFSQPNIVWIIARARDRTGVYVRITATPS